jgi:hypothetical protein
MEWFVVGLCFANFVWQLHFYYSRPSMSREQLDRIQQLIKRDIEEQEYFMKTKAQKIAAALDVGTCTYFEKKELGL